MSTLKNAIIVLLEYLFPRIGVLCKGIVRQFQKLRLSTKKQPKKQLQHLKTNR